MRISILDEPELEFASAGRHVDPRFGIVDYGPTDAGAPTAPSEIRVGIVGTARDIDGLRGWFERCRSEIGRKPSHQPHLFPAFPGFNEDAAFRSTLVFDDRLEHTISQRDIEIAASAPTRQAVEKTVELYRREIDALADERRCDVVVCARPDELHDEDAEDGEPSEE
ncbi:MAG: argonaute/piwi family protein, partial [bacterium]